MMTARGREGDEVEEEGFGEFEIGDLERWSLIQVQPGVIALIPFEVEGHVIEAPLFITKRWVEGDGSLTAEFISLGTTDPQTSRKLTQVSKTLNLINFCMTADCRTPGNYLSHVQKVFRSRVG